MISTDRQKGGYDQTYRRFEALTDMYNMISFCCVIRALLGIDKLPSGTSSGAVYPPNIDPRRLFNHDASSTFLLDKNKTSSELLLTDGARQALKKKGMSPAATKPSQQSLCQPRSLGYTSLINAAGVFLGIVFRIKDSSFTKGQCQLHKLNSQIYVLTVGEGVSKEIEAQWIVRRCIGDILIKDYLAQCDKDDNTETLISFDTSPDDTLINDGDDEYTDDDEEPSDTRKRKATEEVDLESSAGSTSDAGDVNTAAMQETDTSTATKFIQSNRVIVFYDGAQEQSLIHASQMDPSYETAKSNGACSPIFQASDTSRSFMDFRRLLHSLEMIQVLEAKDTDIHYTHIMTKVEKILSNMDMRSRRTYVRTFSKIPEFLSISYSSEKITEGWRKSRIWPYNQKEVLLLADSHKHVTNNDLDALYVFIEVVGYDEAVRTGEASEVTMEEHCTKIVGLPARGSSRGVTAVQLPPILPIPRPTSSASTGSGCTTISASSSYIHSTDDGTSCTTFTKQNELKLCGSSMVLLDREHGKTKKVKPLEQMPMNHWRFTHTTHPAVRQKLIDAHEQKANLKKQQEQKRQEAAQNKVARAEAKVVAEETRKAKAIEREAKQAAAALEKQRKATEKERKAAEKALCNNGNKGKRGNNKKKSKVFEGISCSNDAFCVFTMDHIHEAQEDGWVQCTTCERWFCYNCATLLEAHILLHSSLPQIASNKSERPQRNKTKKRD